MQTTTTLGLRANWQQFSLLVLINAFVGGMVGLERSIFPRFAHEVFGIESSSAILSFIIAFGISKALTNYFTGRLANRWGRRRLLILGWLLALPIPFILIYAPSWNWVIFSNILLGMSQGLAWSSTVVMKIDLVGDKDRGLAMGLNEFAGYFAVGTTAFLSGWIADEYGVTPYPFYVGIGIAVLGLLGSLFLVRDTGKLVQQAAAESQQPLLQQVFWDTTLRDRNLSSITQAGLINNLNDGMVWGLLPILLASYAYDDQSIGAIAAIYPTVWGLSQLVTGKLADHIAHKRLLFWGMLAQGLAILWLAMASQNAAFIAISVLLGLGTAVVYPTFLTSIAQHCHPQQRAEALGIFRMWRDLGYALGALLSGITADVLGIEYAIGLIGLLTVASAVVVQVRMRP